MALSDMHSVWFAWVRVLSFRRQAYDQPALPPTGILDDPSRKRPPKGLGARPWFGRTSGRFAGYVFSMDFQEKKR